MSQTTPSPFTLNKYGTVRIKNFHLYLKYIISVNITRRVLQKIPVFITQGKRVPAEQRDGKETIEDHFRGFFDSSEKYLVISPPIFPFQYFPSNISPPIFLLQNFPPKFPFLNIVCSGYSFFSSCSIHFLLSSISL